MTNSYGTLIPKEEITNLIRLNKKNELFYSEGFAMLSV
jgi:hypothetical protein